MARKKRRGLPDVRFGETIQPPNNSREALGTPNLLDFFAGFPRPIQRYASAPPAPDEDEDQDATTGPWSTANTPTQWAKQFKICARTFKRRVKDGKIRAKVLSDRLYQVHLDDMPKQDASKGPGHK
jgi:hypothetical protein